MNEREELDKLTDIELVAYWNILNTPGSKVDDGKTRRQTPIVSELLTERNIPHEKGKRTKSQEETQKEDHSLEFLIYDERSPRLTDNPDPRGFPNLNIAAANDANGTS